MYHPKGRSVQIFLWVSIGKFWPGLFLIGKTCIDLSNLGNFRIDLTLNDCQLTLQELFGKNIFSSQKCFGRNCTIKHDFTASRKQRIFLGSVLYGLSHHITTLRIEYFGFRPTCSWLAYRSALHTPSLSGPSIFNKPLLNIAAVKNIFRRSMYLNWAQHQARFCVLRTRVPLPTWRQTVPRLKNKTKTNDGTWSRLITLKVFPNQLLDLSCGDQRECEQTLSL